MSASEQVQRTDTVSSGEERASESALSPPSSMLAASTAGLGAAAVHEGEFDTSVLTPYVGPPVRRVMELAAVRSWTTPSGKTLVD